MDYSNWLPTAKNINALPEPIKHYLYLLETRADPALTERDLILMKDENDHLRLKLAEMTALLINLKEQNNLLKEGE